MDLIKVKASGSEGSHKDGAGERVPLNGTESDSSRRTGVYKSAQVGVKPYIIGRVQTRLTEEVEEHTGG